MSGFTSEQFAPIAAPRLQSEAMDRVVGAVATAVRRLTARLVAWHRARATYRELMALDDRQLADIGLSRSEIEGIALIGKAAAAITREVGGKVPANRNQPLHAA
jgi:uncharacterized protein YjiS (DUF1127 family)